MVLDFDFDFDFDLRLMLEKYLGTGKMAIESSHTSFSREVLLSYVLRRRDCKLFVDERFQKI